MLFARTTPLSPNWTLDFEPAFSPRFSPTLSPRSFFHTCQRFPISNHVTSGSMSPRSIFDHWSAVTPTGNDMTSLICSRPIRSQSECHTGRLYYLLYYFILRQNILLGESVHRGFLTYCRVCLNIKFNNFTLHLCSRFANQANKNIQSNIKIILI